MNKRWVTPSKMVLITFFLLILGGALLLSLPIATKAGIATPFLDALFTATSAACVTGLVVFDTFTYWSLFGQCVILLLIQIGGMGVVTMAIALVIATGRKIGLWQRSVMQGALSAPQMGGVIRLTRFAMRATLCVEGVGALLLALRFVPEFGFLKGLWYAVFHSVSAFCNAGFDLMGVKQEFSSLTDYAGDPVVSLTIAALIVLGGLGFFVWNDIRDHGLRFNRYQLHTKVVLVTTGILIAAAALYFCFLEFHHDIWNDMRPGERVVASIFQAITPRTAGYNSVDLTKMSVPSLFFIIVLMLIGGSPGSTAGGMKTTTAALLVFCVYSNFKCRQDVQCFQRRIGYSALKNAVTVVFLYLLLFSFGSVFISYTENLPLIASMFETASAIGTVGLTLGITPSLGMASKLMLIGLMYFGRVGGLTLFYAASEGTHRTPSQYPQEDITIG